MYKMRRLAHEIWRIRRFIQPFCLFRQSITLIGKGQPSLASIGTRWPHDFRCPIASAPRMSEDRGDQ